MWKSLERSKVDHSILKVLSRALKISMSINGTIVVCISAVEDLCKWYAQTLSTLIRQCKADRRWEERVDAAETLAYLIEVDVRLQNTASISDQIITTLGEYFKYPGSPPDASLMPTTKVQSLLLVLRKCALYAVIFDGRYRSKFFMDGIGDC